MSWHHGDYIDLFAALGGVVSAGAAAYAAIQSRNSARESLLQQLKTASFERERHLYEILLSDASRANESVRGVEPINWSYPQAANLTYAIESARKRLQAELHSLNGEQIARFKSFFTDQLSHEVKLEMKDMINASPDVFYKAKDNWRDGIELLEVWKENKDFFNFDYVRHSDLED